MRIYFFYIVASHCVIIQLYFHIICLQGVFITHDEESINTYVYCRESVKGMSSFITDSGYGNEPPNIYTSGSKLLKPATKQMFVRFWTL